MSWVEVARAESWAEAMLLRARLEDAGIQVRVEGEGVHGVLPLRVLAMRLLVPSEEVMQARALVARWQEEDRLAADD